MARKQKVVENEKHPLDDLKNDEITKKRSAAKANQCQVASVSEDQCQQSPMMTSKEG